MGLSSGFNPVVVTTAINGVNKAQASLMRVLVDGINTQFVTPMSHSWACQEAVDFFKTFKESIDDLVSRADSTLQSVVDTMNQGGVNWANRTGNGAAFTKTVYTNYSKRISVDGIKENIDNVRGVDPASSKSALAAFTALGTTADAALSLAVSAVANCGFLGGNQQANLTASLKKIREDIKTTFDSYTSQTKTHIDETIETYGKMETKTADTFNLGGSGGFSQA